MDDIYDSVTIKSNDPDSEGDPNFLFTVRKSKSRPGVTRVMSWTVIHRENVNVEQYEACKARLLELDQRPELGPNCFSYEQCSSSDTATH